MINLPSFNRLRVVIGKLLKTQSKMAKKSEPKKVSKKSEFITDIIHEVRDGKLMDVFMSGDKEVKAEEAKEK